MIEGFVSASEGGLPVRLAASGVSVAFLALYLSSGAQSSRSRGAHADGECFDFAETGHGFGVDARLVEQQQLSLGQKRREGIREVVPQFAQPLRFRHALPSDERQIECPHVVLA